MKQNILETKKYKKYFVNLILSLMTYLAFLIYFKVIFSYDSYNFLLLVFFFVLFAFYNKYGSSFKNYDKRLRIISSVFSTVLSFILIVGSLVYSHVSEAVGLIFNFHTIIYALVGIIGFSFFFSIIIALFLKRMPSFVVGKSRVLSKKQFLIIFGFLFLCFMPYFLRYFPAVMTHDSYYSIHYVHNKVLNDFHAFGHTWFFGMFYYIGMALFHNMNIAVGFFIFIQMIICSLIFTYIIKFLYENGVKNVFIVIVTLFFALSPLFAIYSVTLWRDILFGMAFGTLFISLYNFVHNKYEFNVSIITMYILSILVILFFRNNGIYVFLLFIPFLILFCKKNRGVVTIGNVLIVILYFVIKGPIFSYFGVEKTTSVEAFSMPLQQISRVIVNEGNIDKNTYKYLKDVIDIPKVKETYDPTISDFVKRAADNEKISSDKLRFLMTWLKIGMKNPRIYIEGYMCATLGYWYPDVIYWATAGKSKSIFKDVDVYSDSLLPDWADKIDLTSRKIPLSIILWSIGTMFILLLASTCLMVYKRKYKYLVAYIPLYCLWFSLMLASPVFAELRYIYGLFVCAPLLIFVPFFRDK